MSALPISVYRLRGTLESLSDFLIEPAVLKRSETSESVSGAEFWHPEISGKVPPWWSAVQRHFPGVPKQQSQSPRGVILLRSGPYSYAVPFGPQGFALLKPSRIYRGWGRKIALNLLYDKDTRELLHGGRLLRGQRAKDFTRGITSDTISSQAITHEEFRFNSSRQILRGVQARVDRNNWGRNISGSDSLKLSWKSSLARLPELCQLLERDFARTDYKRHFEFIDNFEFVHDAQEKQQVWSRAVRAIREGALAELGLSPPGPEDLSQLSFAVLGISGQNTRGGHGLSDLDLTDYRSVLSSLGRLKGLDLDEFMKHRLRVKDASDELRHEGRLRDWLDGVVAIGGDSFALSEGNVFRVADRFVDSLDEKISAIDATAGETLSLMAFSEVPTRKRRNKKKNREDDVRDERAYNMKIGAPDGRLMLDARNVITIPGRTSAVEFCDVLTTDRMLLHVKKGKGSGPISYVCGQATVSSELLCSSRDFRKQARAKIRQAAKDDNKDPAALEAVVPLKFPRRPDHTVVLGIVEKSWFDHDGLALEPQEVLPLFGKIEVCRALDRLTELGFRLQIARIDQ